MRRKSLPDFALLLMIFLLGVVILVFLYFNFFLSIKETPTCIRYEFSVNNGNIGGVLSDAKFLFSENGLKEIARRGNSYIWSDPNVRVSWDEGNYLHDVVLFICANKSKSNNWQKVAAEIEGAIRPFVKFKTVSIQLNSSVYYCNQKCQVVVKEPVDFMNLNRSLLAFPTEK